MMTNTGEVLRLPASAVPEGCPAWDGEPADRWTRTLPPRGVPLGVPLGAALWLPLFAVFGAGALAHNGVLPGWAAVLLALHLVWTAQRPEAVLVGAPVAVVAVVALGDWPGPSWLLPSLLVAALTAVWTTAVLRLSARRRQRAVALVAAGGATAVLPPAAGKRSRRGRFLIGFGSATVAAGAVVSGAAYLWAEGADRQGVPAGGWCLAGLGLTVLFSGVVGRRRAAALRAEPVPVLRVLLREGRDGDMEVYAADDTTGGRPLFTVATGSVGDDDSEDDEDEGGEDEDGEGDGELLDRLVEDRVGPLREAVLYGVPWDGAEVVVLAAAEKAGEPPVVEAGSGPVRPVTGWNLRRRAGEARRRAARESWYRAQGRSAEEAAERGLDEAPVALRRWRAGWGDWVSMAAVVLWAAWFTGDHGIRHYVVGVGVSLLAARVLPRRLCWRITADRDGLWLAGFRGPRLLAWDDIRTVRCRRSELRIVGTRASFDDWAVDAFRWPWLEGRLGVLHRYERTAAEITAMWRDPALRPTGTADERLRGRALWPLGVVIGVVGVAAVLFVP
ncbi:hypothetical protein ABZ490_31955 [Streptomyces sp. NPDC005811]|uniref:hypothetical protein n=1 Tax=Streptomyces sp. NPDC005811 TaxID=3154565 RepID=UPI0033F6A34F